MTKPITDRIEEVAHWLRELAAGAEARGMQGHGKALREHRVTLLEIVRDLSGKPVQP